MRASFPVLRGFGVLVFLSGLHTACTTDLADMLPGTQPVITPDAATDTQPDVDSGADAAAGDASADGGDAGDSGGGEAGADAGDASRPVDECQNEELDGLETSADCGGGECSSCGLGLNCLVNSDCETGLCDGVCIEAGCGNGFKDSEETGRDCGGVCPTPCNDGVGCRLDADCVSQVCGRDNICAAPRCDDETHNGDEVDVDCGDVSECGKCENGLSCLDAADCESNVCAQEQCAPATCADEEKNGLETDVNCGGECARCDTDQECLEDTDCLSLRCEETGDGVSQCQAPSCDDETLNGAETDVDCGGDCDLDCDVGQTCLTAEDCIEHACRADEASGELECQAPACDDGARNGAESGIDCGGPGDCDRCEVDASCLEHSDCVSNSCDGTCLAPTCEDERKNLDETDADCGGELCDNRCGFDAECALGSDCLSSVCSADGLCEKGVRGSACRTDSGCLSGSCEDDLCEGSAHGEVCSADSDCFSDFCDAGVCGAVFTGGTCAADADCHSGHCSGDVCTRGDLGKPCAQGSDCGGGSCGADGLCAALDLVVQSNGDSAATEISVSFSLAAGSVAVPWSELAVQYFFTLDPADEAAYVSIGNYYVQGSGLASHQCVGVTSSDWIYTWRSNNSGNVGNTFSYTVKLNNRSSEGLPVTVSNDHSYRPGNGANADIVLCRLVDGEWLHVQGVPPSSIPEPCQYVVPDCDDVICDAP